MQSVQVFNARAYATSIAGLGKVSAASRRNGFINGIVFDDNFLAYVNRAASYGVLVRDAASLYTPTGYVLHTAVSALATTTRFAVATSASADYVLTLMAASAVAANTIVYFYFESGGFAANITRAGSDTVDGAATALALNTGTPVRRLQSDGVSAWISV